MLFSISEFSNLEPPWPVERSCSSVLIPIKGDLFFAGEIYVGLIPLSAILLRIEVSIFYL
jgi:hypothetical protein